MVPPVFRKYLTTKPKNATSHANSSQTVINDMANSPNISEIRKQIYRYNDAQTVINEDTFGPLQNDSVIIVIQVSYKFEIWNHVSTFRNYFSSFLNFYF